MKTKINLLIYLIKGLINIKIPDYKEQNLLIISLKPYPLMIELKNENVNKIPRIIEEHNERNFNKKT